VGKDVQAIAERSGFVDKGSGLRSSFAVTLGLVDGRGLCGMCDPWVSHVAASHRVGWCLSWAGVHFSSSALSSCVSLFSKVYREQKPYDGVPMIKTGMIHVGLRAFGRSFRWRDVGRSGVYPLAGGSGGLEVSRRAVGTRHGVSALIWFFVCFARVSRDLAASADTAHLGPSDEALVERWRSGDDAAFEALVRRYQHVAYTMCYRYVGNPQVAEETAQDIFLTLFRKLKGFRGDASFKSWFYRVVVNHARNQYKAMKRRKRDRHESMDALDEHGNNRASLEPPDPSPSPLDRIEASRRDVLLQHALERIDGDLRMLILLREGRGLAYDEIARILELPIGTVKSRIHRARAELRKAVRFLENSAPHGVRS